MMKLTITVCVFVAFVSTFQVHAAILPGSDDAFFTRKYEVLRDDKGDKFIEIAMEAMNLLIKHYGEVTVQVFSLIRDVIDNIESEPILGKVLDENVKETNANLVETLSKMTYRCSEALDNLNKFYDDLPRKREVCMVDKAEEINSTIALLTQDYAYLMYNLTSFLEAASPCLNDEMNAITIITDCVTESQVADVMLAAVRVPRFLLKAEIFAAEKLSTPIPKTCSMNEIDRLDAIKHVESLIHEAKKSC